MKTREERQASLTYFAYLSCRNREFRIWTTGYVMDAYPDERWYHLQDWERQKRGYYGRFRERILGEFSTAEKAYTALYQFFDAQCRRLNKQRK